MCEGGIKGGGNCGTALAQIRRRSSPSLSALSHAAPPSCENQADLPWNEEVSAPLFWGHWVKPGRSHWCCRRARFCKFSLTSAQLASSAKPWTTPAVICWAGSTRASSYVFSGGTSGKVSHSCPTCCHPSRDPVSALPFSRPDSARFGGGKEGLKLQEATVLHVHRCPQMLKMVSMARVGGANTTFHVWWDSFGEIFLLSSRSC